ncbi:MAG: DUF389 domain-containing protein [Gemmatimonadaceae bacterium]|nr:DUF389 domain-containing protein [Gemmatimonadaceae bacterium]
MTASQNAPYRFGIRVLRPFVKLRRRLTLQPGTDIDGTTARITEGIRQQSEAPWMLVCSCLIASIGLDVSSTAVVIGAMLISPLMSPILGIGLAAGIADRGLLITAARELAVSTVAALITSTIYFLVSPLSEPTPELIARTTPTLLDVAVAFFGGIAGIVAGSRRQPSLALPGAAIATALMPPLCTAGFGIATGRPEFFFGALYLFVLNALFIALATFVMVRLLHFPLVKFGTPAARRHEVRVIGTVAAFAVMPSLWFLFTTVQARREDNRIASFVKREISQRGHDVLRWVREAAGDTTVVKVFIAGRPVSPFELDTIQRAAALLRLGETRVHPVQSEITREDLSRVEGTLRTDVLALLALAQTARDSARDASRRSAQPINRTRDSAHVRQLALEIRATFPEVDGVRWSPVSNLIARDSIGGIPELALSFSSRVSSARRRDIRTRVEDFVALRSAPDSMRVIIAAGTETR